MIKLSVVVPVYNVEDYLRECLDSLVSQTLKSIEVIIVNDGSTDNSQEIINDYVKKYPNFHCYEKENGGLGDARNYALPYCTGEYITFLDSDDYVAPDAYEKAYQLANQKQADIVMFDLKWFYPEGKQEIRPTVPTFLTQFNENAFILSNPAACNKIFKRNLWVENEITFPVGLWYEDLATIPALALVTDKIAYLPEDLYYYRQREHSIMSKQEYSPRFLEIIRACDRLYEKLQNSKYTKELEYLFIFQLLYYAELRLLPFKAYSDIEKCVDFCISRFPNWEENKYYQTRPFLFQLFCKLVLKKNYRLLHLLVAIRGNS